MNLVVVSVGRLVNLFRVACLPGLFHFRGQLGKAFLCFLILGFQKIKLLLTRVNDALERLGLFRCRVFVIAHLAKR